MTTPTITETIDILKEMDAFVSFGNPALGQSDEIRAFWAITPVSEDLEGPVEATYFNCVEGAETTSRQFLSIAHLVEEMGFGEEAVGNVEAYWPDLDTNEALSYDDKNRVGIIGRLDALTTESVEELTEKKAEYKTATGFHKASFAAHSSREKKSALGHAKAKAAELHHAQKAKSATTRIGRMWHAGLAKWHSNRAKAHSGVQAHHIDMMKHHATAAGMRTKKHSANPSMAKGATKAGRAAMKAPVKQPKKAAPAPPPAAAPKAKPKAAPASKAPASPKPPHKPSWLTSPSTPKMAKPSRASSGSPKKPVQPSRKKTGSYGTT